MDILYAYIEWKALPAKGHKNAVKSILRQNFAICSWLLRCWGWGRRRWRWRLWRPSAGRMRWLQEGEVLRMPLLPQTCLCIWTLSRLALSEPCIQLQWTELQPADWPTAFKPEPEPEPEPETRHAPHTKPENVIEKLFCYTCPVRESNA